MKIVEVRTHFDEHKALRIRKYRNREEWTGTDPHQLLALGHFSYLGELYDSFIHTKGSKVWNYLPLTLKLGAMTLMWGEEGIGPQFTSDVSTLHGVRDFLADNRWPHCISARAPLTDEPDDLDLFEIHGVPYDGYRAFSHDGLHAGGWNYRTLEQRLTMPRVYDCLMSVLSRHPPELPGLEESPVFHRLRDDFLTGYGKNFLALAPTLVENALRHLSPEFRRKFTEDFQRELAAKSL